MADTEATPTGGDDREPVTSTPAPVWWKRRPSKKWVLLALAVAAVVALVLPVFSTLQPGYYERYPSLRVRMANWRLSTHSKMSCEACHVDPGAAGYLAFAAKSIPSFYSQLMYGPKAANLLSAPSSAACEKCHTIYRQVSPNGDLLIPHRAHVEVLEISCATCHKSLVHSANSQGFNKPEMATCLRTCHNAKQATDQCTKCHTRKEVPENHKQADWLDTHAAKMDSADCGKCHAWSPDFCSECHAKRPASHAGNFKQTHQVRVAARGTKGCDFCHAERTFCKECH